MSARKLTLAALALTLAAGAAAAQEVNVYNSRHYNTDRELYDSFTRATGIKVNIVEGDADQLIQRLKSEASSPRADLLITVDAGRIVFAQNEGVLQPVRSAALEQAIPAALRDPDGNWFGLSMRARVLVYAKGKIDPKTIPTYESLADPGLKGRLLVRSSTNIYNLSLVGSIIAAHGEATAETWARGIAANLARAPKGGDTDQLRAVAAGEGDVAISNTYYLARLGASPKPEDRKVYDALGVVFPNQGDRGTQVNISAGAVVKGAPNRDNAIKLLEHLVTPQAQKHFADGNFEYPISDEAKPHAILASWGAFKSDTLNAKTFAANNRLAGQVTDRAGWR